MELSEKPDFAAEYELLRKTGMQGEELQDMCLNIVWRIATYWAETRGASMQQTLEFVQNELNRCVRSNGRLPVTRTQVNDAAKHAVLACFETRRTLYKRNYSGNSPAIIGKTDYVDELADMQESFLYTSTQLRTNIAELDEALGEIYKGDIFSIIGTPGTLKTSFALNLIDSWLEDADPRSGVTFFSLDMGRNKVMERIARRELHCGASVLRSIALANNDEWQNAVKRLDARLHDRLMVLTNDQRQWTMQELKEYVETHSVDLLIIDYVTMIEIPGAHTDLDKQNALYPMFKRFAQDYKIAVVLLSQLSNESRKQLRSGDAEGVTARGGGKLQELVDAEIVLMSVNPEIFGIEGAEHDAIVAYVSKARNGRKGGYYHIEPRGADLSLKTTAERVYRTGRKRRGLDFCLVQ